MGSALAMLSWIGYPTIRQPSRVSLMGIIGTDGAVALTSISPVSALYGHLAVGSSTLGDIERPID